MAVSQYWLVVSRTKKVKKCLRRQILHGCCAVTCIFDCSLSCKVKSTIVMNMIFYMQSMDISSAEFICNEV